MLILIKIIVFLSVLGVSYMFYHIMMDHKVINRTINKIYRQAKEEAQLREDEERRMLQEDGRQEKVMFIRSIDLLIERSNISSKLPFINTGTYIILTILLITLSVLVIGVIFHSGLLMLFVGLLVLFLSYFILYVLSGINFRKTEKNIIEFANMLENYSKSNDDIITILYKVYPFLDNPLHDAIEECVYIARSTGNRSKALMSLENKIELEKFQEIIRNIEIASRHQANYDEIIKDGRKMLRNYLAAREEKKALISNNRSEMLLINVLCIFIVKILDKFSTVGIIRMLFHTLVGNLIIGYFIIILFITFWILIAKDK